ncbi:MAG: signal peptidase I [Bdellovibrionales bacterium]|nr:signal peptidase I [Bdellovibrionales bacterium]
MAQKKAPIGVEDNIKKVLREYSEALLLAIVIALLVRVFIFSSYKIPTEAMVPTLQVGDFIIGSKLSYGFKLPFIEKQYFSKLPKRGEVVIFKCKKSGASECIKRIVALPGDRVQIIKKNLFINNKKADYQFLPLEKDGQANVIEKIGQSERIISITHSRVLENYGPVVVPPKHFFVLGDARDSTEDSRVWGMIPFKHLQAKALFVWMSLDWRDYWAKKGAVRVRWDRIFKKIE